MKTMMESLPIQYYISEAFDNHIKGIVRIKKKEGSL
jgi:hypothetical protein